ncbi:phosphodiester glycosidase family protein [Cohnella cellulosilytica]|uniref:phosphodiester glycosidase family protein n=1 Tax=Cohnella cellulosilytica TaxID=986710 RepID=UPI003605DB54
MADGKQIAPDIASKTVDRDHLYFAGGRFGIGDISGVDGVTWAAQGAPRLIQAGKNVADAAAELENVQSDIKQLQPRLAAGIKTDGTLILVLVDGRGNADRGLYLSELAAVMLHYGAHDAINLDGGGSATLYSSFPELRASLDIKRVTITSPICRPVARARYTMPLSLRWTRLSCFRRHYSASTVLCR